MAFPSSPTNGQTYAVGGVTYIYNSTTTTWQIQTYNNIDATSALAQIKTVDGASSGLDADLLDGVTSGSFLRSDASDSYTAGTLGFSSGTTITFASGSTINFSNTTGTKPFNVTSTTLVNNLNADLLDGVSWGNVNTPIVSSSYLQISTPFYMNSNTVTANFTIPTNYNAMSAGPVTVNSGITVTIPTGSEWTIV